MSPSTTLHDDRAQRQAGTRAPSVLPAAEVTPLPRIDASPHFRIVCRRRGHRRSTRRPLPPRTRHARSAEARRHVAALQAAPPCHQCPPPKYVGVFRKRERQRFFTKSRAHPPRAGKVALDTGSPGNWRATKPKECRARKRNVHAKRNPSNYRLSRYSSSRAARGTVYGADRNGRHWLRVELSSTLLKYRTALTWQFWKRRPNGVFAQATWPWRYLELYIVPSSAFARV